MSLPFLQPFGLTENESNLYELLLRLGEVPAWQIVKESGLKRPTVYKTLYSLQKKKLVTTNEKEKVIRFQPVSPSELLQLAERQFQSLERAKQNLQAALPQLSSLYTTAIEKPVVRVFEGVEGLKEIYEDMLKEGKPIDAVLQTHQVDNAVYEWLTGPFIKKRVKLGITARVIAGSSGKTKVYKNKDKKELRETRVVSEDVFPIQHELDVYGNKVAFINFKKGEALIGIVINHPHIAHTMRATFDLAWNGAMHL